MPVTEHLSKLLQQIELAPHEQNILKGCAEATVAANWSDFDPVITVRPFLFQEQLRALVTEKEFKEMKEETNDLKKLSEIEREQMNFIKELIDIGKAKCANDKDLDKQSKEFESKVNQYEKEINVSGYEKHEAIQEAIDSFICALDKLNSQK